MMRDIYALLQVYAEGIDFMEPLPDMVNPTHSISLNSKTCLLRPSKGLVKSGLNIQVVLMKRWYFIEDGWS